mmetsp:Transcript_38160/g.85871  ORF Transcript_38160/g.85871 Transcript_38160/m.85871 type:complete len:152 (-) Transcript_38160:52-507(-)
MARSLHKRSAGGILLLLGLLLSARCSSRGIPFAAPIRAAVAATALLGSLNDPVFAEQQLSNYYDTSSIQTAELPVTAGGAVDGGLDGTYSRKKEFKNKLLLEDARAIKEEEKFEEKFDSYLGVFAILFIGAFIAPMVTYLWYVKDDDPWKN